MDIIAFLKSPEFIVFAIAIILLFILLIISYKNKKAIRAIGYLGVFYGLVYMSWRFGFSMPKQFSFGMVFGIILVITEFVGMMQSLVFKTMMGTDKVIEPKKDLKFKKLPTLDVIISTYNEPLFIVSRTVLAALKIEYSKCRLNVYVGDDGSREEIKEFCEKCGAHYVSREDHSHAKAGNINNVLNHSNGELVLVLDADMIPKKSIALDMIYYFEDSKTGFVQSPQVFYNNDVYQNNLKVGKFVPNEQDFFMRNTQEKRAAYNAVLHVGSNAVFRREAIEAIGGIPTASITEDMATGMLIQAKGYKSFFVNKPLALGLSVENISDQIKQRDRWLRGNIQVSKKYNPLNVKGLTLMQRIVYVDGLFYWTFGLQKMVYTIAPFLYLIFGVTLFDSLGLDIILVFLPYFLSNILYFRRVSNSTRNITWSHIYDMALAPHMAWAFLTEVIANKALKFNVTPKATVTNKDHFNFRLAFPHIILFAITLVAMTFGIVNIVNNWGNISSLPATIINLVWCGYNGFGTLIALFIFIDRKSLRGSIRIPATMNIEQVDMNEDHEGNVCENCGELSDLSDNGASLTLSKLVNHYPLNVGNEVKIKIADIGTVGAKIVRKIDKVTAFELGVVFTEVDFDTMNNINQFRFSSKREYMQSARIDKKHDSLLDILFGVFKRKK